MDDRIRFITHQGKQILLVDVSNCSAAELLNISRMVPHYVMPEPRGSVLLLADFTGAQFDRDAITSLKESAVFDRPHLKKSAWVGTENLPRVFYEHIKNFSQRELPDIQDPRRGDGLAGERRVIHGAHHRDTESQRERPEDLCDSVSLW